MIERMHPVYKEKQAASQQKTKVDLSPILGVEGARRRLSSFKCFDPAPVFAV